VYCQQIRVDAELHKNQYCARDHSLFYFLGNSELEAIIFSYWEPNVSLSFAGNPYIFLSQKPIAHADAQFQRRIRLTLQHASKRNLMHAYERQCNDERSQLDKVYDGANHQFNLIKDKTTGKHQLWIYPIIVLLATFGFIYVRWVQIDWDNRPTWFFRTLLPFEILCLYLAVVGSLGVWVNTDEPRDVLGEITTLLTQPLRLRRHHQFFNFDQEARNQNQPQRALARRLIGAIILSRIMPFIGLCLSLILLSLKISANELYDGSWLQMAAPTICGVLWCGILVVVFNLILVHNKSSFFWACCNRASSARHKRRMLQLERSVYQKRLSINAENFYHHTVRLEELSRGLVVEHLANTFWPFWTLRQWNAKHTLPTWQFSELPLFGTGFQLILAALRADGFLTDLPWPVLFLPYLAMIIFIWICGWQNKKEHGGFWAFSLLFLLIPGWFVSAILGIIYLANTNLFSVNWVPFPGIMATELCSLFWLLYPCFNRHNVSDYDSSGGACGGGGTP
jgi:hypothetical protein